MSTTCASPLASWLRSVLCVSTPCCRPQGSPQAVCSSSAASTRPCVQLQVSAATRDASHRPCYPPSACTILAEGIAYHASAGYVIAAACSAQTRFWSFDSSTGFVHYNETQVRCARRATREPARSIPNSSATSAVPHCGAAQRERHRRCGSSALGRRDSRPGAAHWGVGKRQHELVPLPRSLAWPRVSPRHHSSVYARHGVARGPGLRCARAGGCICVKPGCEEALWVRHQGSCLERQACLPLLPLRHPGNPRIRARWLVGHLLERELAVPRRGQPASGGVLVRNAGENRLRRPRQFHI